MKTKSSAQIMHFVESWMGLYILCVTAVFQEKQMCGNEI